MYRIFRKLLPVMLVAFSQLALAAQIQSVRTWSGPEGSRLVLDADKPLIHKILVLENPNRVVIDIDAVELDEKILAKLDLSKSQIERIRYAPRNKTDLRVVLDMKDAVTPKSFVLEPFAAYGHRLVIDLKPNPIAQTPNSIAINTQPQPTTPVPPSALTTSPEAVFPVTTSPETTPPSRPVPTITTRNQQLRPVVVAIDAGHGGEDPGAIGKKGTQEKDVVYAIAERLMRLLNQTSGIKPLLIRNGDYYVSLRGRINKARQEKADLFVSIHADAVKNGSAEGASVYILSQKGASSEAARWLAASQNDADLIGGVSLDDKDDLLASVLLDLSQNATIAASSEVGSTILQELKQVGNVHKESVEQAGFVVLKSPDIPSILVETGFISNTTEERKLGNQRFQNQVAGALAKGIRRYMLNNPPAGSLLAMQTRRHEIKPGETLAAIARFYEVSLNALINYNGLRDNSIKVGQLLSIPGMGGS